MTTAVSPSKVTSCSPISTTNCTSRLQARVSTVATDQGSGICIDRVPMTTPLLSRIITPKLVESVFLNNARLYTVSDMGQTI